MSYYARGPDQTRTIRKDLHQSKNFSFVGLLLALAGTVTGTAVPAFLGEGPGPTLIGAVVLSLLTSLGLAGSESGTAKGAKAIIALLLAGSSIAITVGGLTVTDLIRGKSLSGDTRKTFPVEEHAAQPPVPVKQPSNSPPGQGGPDIDIQKTTTCGSPKVGASQTCAEISVTSTGKTALRITSFEFDGSNPKEFVVDKKNSTCKEGAELSPADSCSISVVFKPARPGGRSARLVVHQNLPGAPSYVSLSGGSGGGTTPPSSPPTTSSSGPSAPAVS
jgi:hypothetical protein